MASKKNSGQPEKPEKKKSSASSSGAKAAPRKKSPKVKTEYERSIPANVIIACVSLILFVLFIVITVNPEGKLLLFIRSVLLGLFAKPFQVCIRHLIDFQLLAGLYKIGKPHLTFSFL